MLLRWSSLWYTDGWAWEGDKVLWTAKDERFAMLILSVTGWFAGTSYGLVGAHAKASIDSHGRIFSFYIAHQYTKLSFPSTPFDFYITIRFIGCRYSKQSRESTEGCLFQTALNLESKPFLFSAYCCAVPQRNVFLAPGLLIWKVSFSHAFLPSSFCTCAALHYRAFWPSPFDTKVLFPQPIFHIKTLLQQDSTWSYTTVSRSIYHTYIQNKMNKRSLHCNEYIGQTINEEHITRSNRPKPTNKSCICQRNETGVLERSEKPALATQNGRCTISYTEAEKQKDGKKSAKKHFQNGKKRENHLRLPTNMKIVFFGTATKPCACHAKWTLQDFCFFVTTCAFFGGSLFRDLANSSQACFGQRSCEFVSRDCVGFFDDLYVYVFLLQHCLGWWVAPKSTSGVGGSFPRRDAKKKIYIYISIQNFTQYIIQLYI